MFGWIYFALDTYSNSVKIGKTYGNPLKRVKQLQTARGTCSPFLGKNIILTHSFFCENCDKAEKDLHSFFEPFHIRGEWFFSDVLSYADDMAYDTVIKDQDTMVVDLSDYLFDEDIVRAINYNIGRFYRKAP